MERARPAGDDAPPTPDVDWLRARRNVWAHGGAPTDDARADAEGAVRVAFKILFAAAWR